MPGRSISYMKFLFVLAQLEASYSLISVKQNAFYYLCSTCWCFIYYFNSKYS